MKMKCKICGAEMPDVPKRHISLQNPSYRLPNHPYSVVMCDDCVKLLIESILKCGDIEFGTLIKHLDKVAMDLE